MFLSFCILKVEKSSHNFNFGRNLKNPLAILHLRKTPSNIFLTLTDLNYNVVICITGGMVAPGNKRGKITPYIMESIVDAMLPTIEKYGISRFKILLRTVVRAHYFTLISRLKYHRLGIVRLAVRRKIAFNGVKKRKFPRA